MIRTFKQMKDYIVENQGLIGKREFLQLSMQITSNVVEMQDLRRDLRDVEDQVAEVMDTLNIEVNQIGNLKKICIQYLTQGCNFIGKGQWMKNLLFFIFRISKSTQK